MVHIEGKTVLVTGGNRGIGKALVDEAVARGAARVYAGTRGSFQHPDARVTPLNLDITVPEQIAAALREVDEHGPLDVLINNAGIAQYDDLSERAAIEKHLKVNLFGAYDVTQAFLPLLERSGGAVVNNLSVNAFAPFPAVAAYSISKAAAFSMTQSMRTLLAGRGVKVHAVLTGFVDTDMTAGVDAPKAAPSAVARAVFDGLEKDEEDIFPDEMALSQAYDWRNGSAKALERQYAELALSIAAAQR